MIVAIATLTATAEIRVVNLDENSNIKEILGNDTLTIDSLKVKGYLSHSNLVPISWMTMKKLRYLDMGECVIENNTIPPYGLNPEPYTVVSLDPLIYKNVLSFVKLPSTLEKIEEFAFACTLIKTIDLPKSMKYIGPFAFDSCHKLTGHLELPDGIEFIDERAFYYANGITSVKLPESIKELGICAFAGLIGMTEINFPDGLTTIGREACAGWYQYGMQKTVLPASLSTLSEKAFIYSKLNNVEFNKECPLQEIGEEAFLCCHLSGISLPDNCVTIGNRAFESNYLTELYLPDNIQFIGAGAFGSNPYLEKIVLSGKIESIGNSAFTSCEKLKSVYIKAMSPAEIASNSFEYSEQMTLYVPEGAKAAYEAAAYWKNFGAIVEVSEFPSAGREAVIADGSESGRAFGAAGEAVVDGNNVPYAIFRTDGTEVALGVAEGRTTIPLPAGIYVASVGGKARRIAVR